MPTKSSPTNFHPADWQSLSPVLERCYVGPPAGRSGTFPGTVFTLCKLLNGSVHMEKDGHSVTADTETDSWVLCIPGTRTQNFSEDAEIISIHIALGHSQNGAEWTGASVVRVKPSTKAEAALSELANNQALSKLGKKKRLDLHGIQLPIDDYLELQAQTLRVLQHALQFAAQKNMHYKVPDIQDARVRSSHLALAAMDIRESFSRDAIAANEGLTAGQLDRLWRKELGNTPSQYRDRQRLNYACRQLRRPEIPIKVIASELGFRHLSQFSNWFSTRHGESPRSFRNRPGTN